MMGTGIMENVSNYHEYIVTMIIRVCQCIYVLIQYFQHKMYTLLGIPEETVMMISEIMIKKVYIHLRKKVLDK